MPTFRDQPDEEMWQQQKRMDGREQSWIDKNWKRHSKTLKVGEVELQWGESLNLALKSGENSCLLASGDTFKSGLGGQRGKWKNLLHWPIRCTEHCSALIQPSPWPLWAFHSHWVCSIRHWCRVPLSQRTEHYECEKFVGFFFRLLCHFLKLIETPHSLNFS